MESYDKAIVNEASQLCAGTLFQFLFKALFIVLKFLIYNFQLKSNCFLPKSMYNDSIYVTRFYIHFVSQNEHELLSFYRLELALYQGFKHFKIIPEIFPRFAANS